MKRFVTAALAASALTISLASAASATGEPTCSDLDALGVVVHGQHVVRDYVTDGELGGWPASGAVGSAIAGEGAAVPGGPGPGFHFPNGFAPGASFCNEQARSGGR